MSFTFYSPKNQDKKPLSIASFVKDLETGKAEAFMCRLEALFANGVYQVVGDKEVYFHNVMYVLFMLLGLYVEVERHTTDGSMDRLVQIPQYMYMFEMTINQNSDVALCQIDEKGYVAPFASDGRKLFKIGTYFKKIDDWKIV